MNGPGNKAPDGGEGLIVFCMFGHFFSIFRTLDSPAPIPACFFRLFSLTLNSVTANPEFDSQQLA